MKNQSNNRPSDWESDFEETSDTTPQLRTPRPCKAHQVARACLTPLPGRVNGADRTGRHRRPVIGEVASMDQTDPSAYWSSSNQRSDSVHPPSPTVCVCVDNIFTYLTQHGQIADTIGLYLFHSRFYSSEQINTILLNITLMDSR